MYGQVAIVIDISQLAKFCLVKTLTGARVVPTISAGPWPILDDRLRFVSFPEFAIRRKFAPALRSA